MKNEHNSNNFGILNKNVTSESAGAYIKRGLEADFVELARESKDKNFSVAHVCMLHLASHHILCDESKKRTPREAFEKAINHFPNANQTMVKTLVSQFSIRGDEFEDWVENPKRWETLWEIEK